MKNIVIIPIAIFLIYLFFIFKFVMIGSHHIHGRRIFLFDEFRELERKQLCLYNLSLRSAFLHYWKKNQKETEKRNSETSVFHYNHFISLLRAFSYNLILYHSMGL